MEIRGPVLAALVKDHFARTDVDGDYETLMERGEEGLPSPIDPELAEVERAVRQFEETADPLPLVPPTLLSFPRYMPALAASLTLAVIGGTVLFAMNADRPLRPRGDPERKDTRDDLTILVKRGGELLPSGAADRLEVGDHVGFFYSSDRPGYLMIIHRDEVEVSVLDPAEAKQSRRIEAMDGARLGGAEITPGKSCEWFIGVFSDEPLESRDVRAAVARSVSRQGDCALEVAVPGARAVAVHPYRVGGKSR
jgi:hypothetical protein